MALDDYGKWTKGKIYDEIDEKELKTIENVIEYPFDEIGGMDKQKELFTDDLIYLWNDSIETEIKALAKEITDPIEFARRKNELKGKKK
jgi:hypothetical protein